MVRSSFFDKHFWPIVFAVGVVVLAVVGVGAYSVTHAEAERNAKSTIEYVQKQSLTFDSFNDASTMKSLLRLTENASQLARDLKSDNGDLSGLSEHASDLRLTAAIVISPDGSLEGQSAADGVGYDLLASSLRDGPVLDVASHPAKVYTARVDLADGSYVDIGCAPRLDAPGIVVAAYHTSVTFAHRYQLTQQSLLNGYEPASGGAIVVEKAGGVVAASVDGWKPGASSALPAKDDAAIKAIKQQCKAGELAFVRTQSGAYFALFDKARDYYVYTYTGAGKVVHAVGLSVLIALGVYALVVTVIIALRRSAERRYLDGLVKRERGYNEQLEQSAREARSANRAKTEFLQRMSHDIRTPINGIRGMVEIGNAFADDKERQAECRDKIWTASSLLLDLVNEVLDTSKLESGDVVFDMRPTNLVDLNAGVCEMLERQASERDISIECDQSAIEHPCVVASDLHLKRLLMNVAGNAVKYNNPGGYVHFTCREVRFDGVRATYETVIADNGIGMSEEFQKHLFEPFSRENQNVVDKPSGTGLGTVIAKQLVDQMGGSIRFESTLGEGTTCTIRLSFEVAEPDAAVSATEELPPASLQGMNILFAEDNELNAEIALFVLEEAGAHVVHVVDGESEVETFLESEPFSFDVVLTDIMMPGIDGCEAARRIRASGRPDAESVPIIAMSANAFADDRRRSREAGMDAHLAKPFDSDALVKELARISKDKER